MKCNVIACGASSKHVDGIGPSIMVNDGLKCGHQPDYLMLLNTPNQFTHDRLNTIKATNPKKVYTTFPNGWNRLFPNHEVVQLNLRSWSPSNKLQKISRNYLYHSKTSPFAAISLAFTWGFNQVVLYGVDMIDHHTYKPGTGAFINEFTSYKTFCASLKEAGCNVYLGHKESSLNFLPIWNHSH